MKASAIISAVEGVTSKWTKQRKREEREASARRNRMYVMTRRRAVSVKDAAWEIMRAAYLKASANDTLPAHARQIMYAARPHIQATADRDLGSRFDQYFTQQLLPEYIEENGCAWNVVYDARGHFREPHTDEEIPLGTLQVRNHLAGIRSYERPDLKFKLEEKKFPTLGPQHRYGAVLFIEKEGFMPLFEAVELGERYDLAIMSTKGMSVTASRRLVEELCSRHGIPLLLLHDFDKSGFSIAGTLQRSTRRYSFSRAFEIHDLGLRLEDVDGLETEEVNHNGSDEAVAANLRENGATDEEVEFLLSERVELNAFASDELVAFIEGKLDDIGIDKVIPDEDTLKEACHRARAMALINKQIDAIVEKATEEAKQVADLSDLPDRIRKLLDEDPALSWDAALARIVEEAETPKGLPAPPST
jgi:hypothetical protein